jgi:hypothetical protein
MPVRPRGPQPDWEPAGDFQKAQLADIVARMEQHHREKTLPRPPRGLFYDLRPRGMGNDLTYTKSPQMQCKRCGQIIDPEKGKACPKGGGKHNHRKVNPMEANPPNVAEVLAMARRAGKVNENWVEDTRAPSPSIPKFDDWDRGAEGVADDLVGQITNPSVRYSPQDNQPVFIELLVEAEGLIGRCERIAAPYGVPVYSGAGFGGLKGNWLMADRAAEREVPTIVLQISDYDTRGLEIAQAAEEDVIAWSENHYGKEPGWVQFQRIALTEQQAEEHDLLDADGKAEVEGLPVPILDAILTDAIQSYLDPYIARANKERAEEDTKRVTDLVREKLAAHDADPGPD